MKHRPPTVIRIFIFNLIANLVGPALCEETPTFRITEVLRPGPIEFAVMEVAGSQRHTLLSQKMLAAVAKEQEWFIEHVKTTKPGAPLPYHEKLGLSPEEYKELLAEIDEQTIRPTGTIIKAELKEADQVVRLILDDEFAPLNSFRINLATSDLKAPVGDIGKPRWASKSEPNIAIGPWEGYIWEYQVEDLATDTVRIVSLSILRRKTTNRWLWSVKDGEVINGEVTRNVDFMLEQVSPTPTSE